MGEWIFPEGAGAAARVFDAILFLRPLEIGPVPLGKGTHIHEENVDVQVGMVFLGNNRLFCGVHAADG